MSQTRNTAFDLQIGILGVSHRTTDGRVRDFLARAAVSESLKSWHIALSEGSGLVLLSTCNRTEWIISAPPGCSQSRIVKNFSERWLNKSGLSAEEYGAAVYHLEGLPALEHIYRVASSLDSLIPGEPQILGQIKQALLQAEASHTLNPNLSGVLQDAIRTSKKVRRETQIGTGSLSVASLAAKTLADKTKAGALLMIGTGKTARLFLRNWMKYSTNAHQEIYVTGRNPVRVRSVAREFGASELPWSGYEKTVSNCTKIVGAVSVKEPVLNYEMLKPHWDSVSEKVSFLDLSVPRSIDVSCSKLPHSEDIDIDSLRTHVEQNLSGRQESLSEASEIVSTSVRRYVKKKRLEGFGPLFQALDSKYETFFKNELNNMLSGNFSTIDESRASELEKIFMELKNRSLYFPLKFLKEWGLSSGVSNVIEVLDSHVDGLELDEIAFTHEILSGKQETERASDRG